MGGANTPKRWNGSAWVAVTDKVASDAAAAAAAALASASTKAEASALSALTSRVSDAEDGLVAQADSLTSLSASVGRFSASGLLRVSVEAAPAGAQSRIGLKAAASPGKGASRPAALYLEAVSGDKSRVLVEADAFAVLNGSDRVVPFAVAAGQVHIAKALIKDGDIDSAKIGTVIQSDGFVAGSAGSGWRLQKGGTAEFNTVTIRRQIEVASGSIHVGNFAVAGTLSGSEGEMIPFNNSGTGPDTDLNDTWARQGKTVWARSTPIMMTAGQAARRTYIAAAGMAGAVTSAAGAPPDVWWGWDARVLPLTQWDPGPDDRSDGRGAHPAGQHHLNTITCPVLVRRFPQCSLGVG